MLMNKNNKLIRNLFIVLLFIIITLFTAFQEGFMPLISMPFWVVIVAGFSISIWLAFSISTKRFLSLMLGIFIIEYFKETVGIRSGMWVYHGTDGFYNFGVWAWVMGGFAAYTIATRIMIRQMQRLKFSVPKWVNPVILTAIFLIVPSTIGNYGSGAGTLFWLFYISLFIGGIYSSLKMDFPIFAGIVITAWILGTPSEYIGSAASNVWTFTHNPDYPPFFLVAGLWPLEILAQYSLSAFLANEPLNQTGGESL